ncbi:Sec-independent protein translocase TatB [Rhodoluna limnophila]|uniref:Sec-independent protein translocase TatB n=1 Tax=Rhodoluna limnophila TaxID=232537 RepID=UPI0011060B09|nr:Sec-independent protein translocase TatB [Rhodoluna limnophila]
MFGLTGEKLLILGLIAVFVLGPDRLPTYAKQLANLVKSLRRMADGAKDQLSAEIGEELDWKKLDPRQYDPRRIIREALVEDGTPVANPAQVLNTAKVQTQPRLVAGEQAPFDSEAT